MPSSSERQPGDEPARAAVARTLDLVLTADWLSPSVARDRVRAWLNANGWSPADVADLVLAINEAVSNSIEHGYGMRAGDAPTDDLVEVHATLITGADGSRWVDFTVRDNGIWRPPVDDPLSNRGQGIRLMRACVEDLTMDCGDGGTTVALHSRPVPPPLRRT